eukprot:COSAG01_NODE_26291_length_718_cov_2.087237_1_plen_158_part_10
MNADECDDAVHERAQAQQYAEDALLAEIDEGVAGLAVDAEDAEDAMEPEPEAMEPPERRGRGGGIVWEPKMVALLKAERAKDPPTSFHKIGQMLGISAPTVISKAKDEGIDTAGKSADWTEERLAVLRAERAKEPPTPFHEIGQRLGISAPTVISKAK